MHHITEEFLELGKSAAGGWNKPQIEILGLTWPLAHGWKNKVIGKYISPDAAVEFMRLKGKTKRSRNRNFVSDLPLPNDCPDFAKRTIHSFWVWLERQNPVTRATLNDSLAYILRKNNQTLQSPPPPTENQLRK